MRSHQLPSPTRPGRPLARLAILAAAALVALAPSASAQTGAPAVFGAGLGSPISVTQLADGRVLVAEYGGQRISAYPATGGTRTTFATLTGRPYDVTQLADGRVLVASGGQVLAFSPSGSSLGTFASGLSNATSVTQLADGRVLVVDRGLRVLAYPPTGGPPTVFSNLNGFGDIIRARQLADGRVLVVRFIGSRVYAFSPEGSIRGEFGSGLTSPIDVTQLADGRVLVALIGGADQILSFDAAGGSRTVFASGLSDPYGVTQLADSRVLAAEFTGSRVLAFGDAVLPPVACSPDAPLSFDEDGSGSVTAADFATEGGVERVSIRHEGAGGAAVDLSTCSFVSFDPFSETVVHSEVTAGTVDPFDIYTLATGGGDQPLGRADALFDAPGAFALVTGTASAGDPVSSVFGRVVAAVVYGRDGSVFGSMRGGLPEPEAQTQAASFAAAMASAFGQATSAEGEGGVDLAVQAWPNPSAGRATVAFGLSEGGAAHVAVYDALGREVAVLADGAFAPGRHEAAVSDLPAGVYVVRVSSPEGVRTARLTVAR